MVLPITIWAGDVGAAVREVPEDAPLTVLGRISAREWTAPSGQTKTFVEVVAERVTVNQTLRARVTELKRLVGQLKGRLWPQA